MGVSGFEAWWPWGSWWRRRQRQGGVASSCCTVSIFIASAVLCVCLSATVGDGAVSQSPVGIVLTRPLVEIKATIMENGKAWTICINTTWRRQHFSISCCNYVKIYMFILIKFVPTLLYFEPIVFQHEDGSGQYPTTSVDLQSGPSNHMVIGFMFRNESCTQINMLWTIKSHAVKIRRERSPLVHVWECYIAMVLSNTESEKIKCGVGARRNAGQRRNRHFQLVINDCDINQIRNMTFWFRK